MKIEIKSWLTGSILFEGDFSSVAEALLKALKARANLSGADLSGANLSGANLYAYAQVSFKGHGECGRMLTVIRQKEGDELRFYCGCFRGTEQELRQYIADSDPKYAKTRTLALDTVLALIAAQNEEVSK